MGMVYTSGPNKAVVISGGCRNDRQIIIGGWGWAWWCTSHVQQFDLGMMTLEPTCKSVKTREGVPVTVRSLVHINFVNERGSLGTACEQFLDMDQEDIMWRISLTLDGHLRAVLSSLNLESIMQDPIKFAQLVKDLAAVDLKKMGLHIISLTIKEVSDSVEYMDSMGKLTIAKNEEQTSINIAVCELEAAMHEADCESQAEAAIFESRLRAAFAYKNCLIMQSGLESEVHCKVAEADNAGNLQRAIENQQLVAEEMMVEMIEKLREAEIGKREASKKHKQLMCDVIKKTDAQCYSIETIARAKAMRDIKIAEAECLSHKLIASAEAYCIVMIANAEVRAMKHKANVYKQYIQPAIQAFVTQQYNYTKPTVITYSLIDDEANEHKPFSGKFITNKQSANNQFVTVL